MWVTSSRYFINWNCCCNSAHLDKKIYSCWLRVENYAPWFWATESCFGPWAVTSLTLQLQYRLVFCWSLFLQLSCDPNTLNTCKYCGVHTLHVYISYLLCRQIYFYHVASVMPNSCSGTIWIAKPFVAEFSFWDAVVQYLTYCICVGPKQVKWAHPSRMEAPISQAIRIRESLRVQESWTL